MVIQTKKEASAKIKGNQFNLVINPNTTKVKDRMSMTASQS